MLFLRKSTLRRAWDGARRAVIPAYGVGAIIALLSGLPIILCAGAGAMTGMIIGATLGVRRPRV